MWCFELTQAAVFRNQVPGGIEEAQKASKSAMQRGMTSVDRERFRLWVTTVENPFMDEIKNGKYCIHRRNGG